MSKKLTAEEVADELFGRGSGGTFDDSTYAAGLVYDNLIPRWQAEPDGDGWYWVEGFELPYLASLNDGKYLWFCNGFLSEIFNRRVCPIGPRPKE